MSYENGRLYTCDLCKTTHFCKCNGEGEIDGGFTRWNKFEPLPDGWGVPSDLKEVINLCPNCYKKYQSILEEFENGRKTNVCKNNN